MGLFVSTTGTDVAIPELGITIVDPTTDRDMGSQFSSGDLERAVSLTSAITSGTLVWRKVAAGAIQTPANYDPNYLEIEEENTGGLIDDRVVTFKDLPPGASYGSPVALTPDSGNVDGVATSVARADHKHDMPTVTPVDISDSTNTEGTANNFVRSDHVHAHGTRGGGTLHAVATTSVAGFMSATDKTKLDALITKSGIVTAGTFAGNPKKATVTFTTAFASANYSVNITGSDGRTWTVESKVAASFVINANANTALTGDVYWQAKLNGEVG
jgi:hypothetical protein